MYSEKKTIAKDSFASLNFRMKHLLDDIIDIAFASDANLKRYHAFSFYVVNKENNTSSGHYIPSQRKIEVYNPSLGPRHIAKCCLHELAHHIDYTKNGKSGHQKPFYECYTKLIYAALDMGILEKSDFYDDWSSDRNKVRKIVDKYEPHKVDYTPSGGIIIKVYNAFSIKDTLKKDGYKWNGVEMVWEKELDDKNNIPSGILDKPSEKMPYYTLSPLLDLKVDACVYIYATGNTYEKRELLKAKGFYYSKEDKVWIKKTSGANARREVKSLSLIPDFCDVTFRLNK